jgi:hypothetical protein
MSAIPLAVWRCVYDEALRYVDATHASQSDGGSMIEMQLRPDGETPLTAGCTGHLLVCVALPPSHQSMGPRKHSPVVSASRHKPRSPQVQVLQSPSIHTANSLFWMF